MPGLGATILGCAGPRLSTAEKSYFASAQPWGFILFARNVEDPEQMRALTAELREAVGRDAPVLVDQEGGRVQRMRAPHWREWRPPLDEVRLAGADAPRVMALRSRIIAAELRAVGIDVNCGPQADIADSETHPFLRNRCYGETPELVTDIARAVAEGMMAGGVLPVMKHMPGHGRSRIDSHHEVPVVTDDADTLRARDFAPFKALADLPMGMTCHLVFNAFDPDNPSTTSPAMIRLIREELGFGGLLMTDDISMQALSGTVAERSAAAIAAGCDLVLHCNGDMAEMQTVVPAAGPLTGRSAARAAAALLNRPQPDPIDIRALDADLETLLKGKVHG